MDLALASDNELCSPTISSPASKIMKDPAEMEPPSTWILE
jgi:hypothetical protein